VILTGIENEIQEITDRIQATIGIAAKTLDNEISFLRNEHVIFPAASTIKIHVLIELFNQVGTGRHKLDEPLDIPAVRLGEVYDRTSSGVLKDLESIKQLSLKDTATLMIILSDNVATNLLIDRLGVEKIQYAIRNLGLKDTRLQRKMMDTE
jgi:beta-lactamase class A